MMLKKIFHKIADNTKTDSFASYFRKKRMVFFLSLLKAIDKSEISILDVGGTVDFWEDMQYDVNKQIRLTILNLFQQISNNKSIETVIGDARDLSCFKDGEFDIVFSNSVIEHLGTHDDQRRMAKEVSRVGERYFIQTPNYYFPIEPHTLFPFFQFFPEPFKILLLQHFNLGWYKKVKTKLESAKIINELRLLKSIELRKLFPEARIYKERFLGFTKSLIAYRFW